MKRLLSAQLRVTNSGFTILEILVVLIILGTLAAIAAPGWGRYMANRRVQVVQGELRQLLEQTQTDARTKRETQLVQVLNEDGMPKIRVGPDDDGDGLPDREIDLGNDNVPAGSVSLTLASPTGTDLSTDAFDFEYDHQGIVSKTFVIEIESNIDTAKNCVAALSLIGGATSGSGGDCIAFNTEVNN